MTHLYYYITAGRMIDDTSRVYIVRLGHGKQADRDYLYLVAHAADHGHYFELRNEVSSAFVFELRQTILNDSQIVATTARELVKAFKRGEQIDRDPSTLSQAHQQRIMIDTAYRCSSLSKR